MKQSLLLRTDVTAVTDRYKGVEESFYPECDGCDACIHITRIGIFLMKILYIEGIDPVITAVTAEIYDGGMAMKFYTWMMRKHLRTKAPVGDLARDMERDRQFPKDGDRASIRKYLEDNDACSGCLAAFEKAWRKYERKTGGAEAGGRSKEKGRHLPQIRVTGI